jgi:hypothetical protein
MLLRTLFLLCVASFSIACPPLPTVTSSSSDDWVLFNLPVSQKQLAQLRTRFKQEKSAANFRALAAALYSNGLVEESRAVLSEASKRHPSELFVFAKYFLRGADQREAIFKAAAAGSRDARHYILTDVTPSSPELFELYFWRAQSWKRSIDPFTRCELALKSGSSLAREVCIVELTSRSQSKDLQTLVCHLETAQRGKE